MRKPIIFIRNTKGMAAIIIVLLMASLVFSVLWQGSTVVISHLNNTQHIVVIDAGHGGYDPGAITSQGLYEKEINLQMAKRVGELLKPSGIQVFLTREEDIDYVPEGTRGRQTKKQADLNYRIDLAKQANAEAFISLHLNSTVTGKNSGAETFYQNQSEEGKRLAESIQEELIKVPGMNRRIAKPGDFYVIKNTPMPAVIVELGYISNPQERVRLQQTWYQDQLARSVAKGIAQYFDLP
ncbi:N-acetylmuramoyl-L-alanine amidase [Desulfitobacterium metallireducens DSM 15288]|uniref:N-acetylmuramoyl-L-alanine amidase n=2 Tax=Desulfitobacterium TaxID=36853 RepID=W0E871_9FIRM|nr:N-acetylmuramoyl-L-alanine amidase [Desulfitobacterium metallireducens]AHF05698.1 N-acetylmuramoyl-L-alanine amidase [Desulfitobacterium metallireducens DSM 15288]